MIRRPNIRCNSLTPIGRAFELPRKVQEAHATPADEAARQYLSPSPVLRSPKSLAPLHRMQFKPMIGAWFITDADYSVRHREKTLSRGLRSPAQ